MKKQIQKVIGCLFLGACMMAPNYAFEEFLFSDEVILAPAHLEFVSLRSYIDSANHIENNLPLNPEEVMGLWLNHSDVLQMADIPMTLELKQAEIIRTALPAENWWQMDKIQDTLYYHFTLNHTRDISGKAFFSMLQRASIIDKEKQDAVLYRQMLNHVAHEVQDYIQNEKRDS